MGKRINIGILFIVVLSFLLTSCGKINQLSNQEYEETFFAMDTAMQLSAYGKDAPKAISESKKRLLELDNMANTKKETSDISKINEAAGKNPVVVHKEIIEILMMSREYSQKSNGVWDITVGPLIELWGIGTEKAKVPSEEAINNLLPLVGYEFIEINEEKSTVMLLKPGMRIDLGGIAKGYAADEVRNIYEKYNIQNGLINLGSSSIYGIGKNKSGNLWTIGLKNPRSEASDDYLGVLKITNKGVSTSGDYERYFMEDGKRYHHILNPSTGYPVDNGVMSVTIIVDGSVENNGMLADILSLTVFELGVKKGLAFVESIPNTSCQITTTDYDIYVTDGFKAQFTELNEKFSYGNDY